MNSPEVASDRHVEVARQPWSLVLTTALDTRLTSALEAAAPLARRVRRKFANDLDATDLSRSVVAPSVMHLLLERDPAGVDGRLPSAGSFVRLSRILLPAILAALPPAVGADQVAVISGISPLDVLNADDLAAALEPLDPSQIVICAPGGDVQWPSDLIPGASVLRADLASLLSAARLDAGNIASPLLEAGDFALSAREPSSGSRRQIVFRAAELQEIRRFVTLLPDGFPRPRAEPPDTESAFERFVRTPRLKADYESFRTEFCVVREAYTQLRKKVEARLERLTGQTLSRGRSDGPL